MKLHFNKEELYAAPSALYMRDPDVGALSISTKGIEIKKIGLVGFYAALHENGELRNGLDNDLLAKALRTFEASPNITVSNTVSADIINADKDHGGVDYFKVFETYDAFLIGNIFIPYDPKNMSPGYGFGGPDCYVSPYATHIKQWAEKAEDLSAKIIFTSSCGASLDIGYFEQYGDFQVLQHETCDNNDTGVAVHRSLIPVPA